MKNILVINRWNDEFCDYLKYLSHAQSRITYITTPECEKNPWMAFAHRYVLVESLSNHEAVLGAAIELSKFESFDAVLALSEFDIDLGGKVREALNVRGQSFEGAMLFKDKVLMKDAVSKAGIRVPRFASAVDERKVNELIDLCGFPIIAKPKVGAASVGVKRLNNAFELRCLRDLEDMSSYEIEEYIVGDIYHVDGVVKNNVFLAVIPSFYIGTCLNYNSGSALGSVNSDNILLNAEISNFTSKALRALGYSDGAFHLELFVRDSELIFLEVGARVGGAEVSYVTREVHNIDLLQMWIDLQIGYEVNAVDLDPNFFGGWLLFPEPQNTPCQLIEVSSFFGKLPSVYKEITPPVGAIFIGNGTYDINSSRVRFKSDSAKSVAEDINSAISCFLIIVDENI